MSNNGHRRKHTIAERDGWDCQYCGVLTYCTICTPPDLVPDGAVPATKDHVYPRSRGGLNTISNLVLACEMCNLAKAADFYISDIVRASLEEKWAGPSKQARYVPGLSDQMSRYEFKRDCRINNKKSYDTELEALEVCLGVLEKHGIELRDYHCKRCGKWHLARPAD